MPGLTTTQEQPRKQQRTFYDDGFRRRAASICIRVDSDGEDEVVVVASRRHAGAWILPGGGIEPGEGRADAAAREAFEEAGVTTRSGVQVFLCDVDNPERRTRTSLFRLDFEAELDVYPDAGNRARKWVPLRDVESLLSALPAQHRLVAHGLRRLSELGAYATGSRGTDPPLNAL